MAEISHFFEPLTHNAEQCKNKTSILMNIHCENKYIMEIIKTKSVDGDAEMGTNAFWIAFAFVIAYRVIGSVVQSFTDAICFALLGNLT